MLALGEQLRLGRPVEAVASTSGRAGAAGRLVSGPAGWRSRRAGVATALASGWCELAPGFTSLTILNSVRNSFYLPWFASRQRRFIDSSSPTPTGTAVLTAQETPKSSHVSPGSVRSSKPFGQLSALQLQRWARTAGPRLAHDGVWQRLTGSSDAYRAGTRRRGRPSSGSS